MSPSELVRHLSTRGGAARRSELVARFSPAVLRRAVDAGVVLDGPRGVVVLPAVDPAVVSAVVHRARLTCVTAADFLGLAVLDVPGLPHLVVPRSRGSTPSDVRDAHPARLHRAGSGTAATGVAAPRVPIVRPGEALARMLLCQPPTHAVVTIDSALQRGVVTREQIRAALPRTAPMEAGLLLRQVDHRSRSPMETLARLALVGAGFRVEPGCRLPRVGEVDLLVEGAVVVELDGFAYHSGRREYREDRRRDRELVAMGLTVLRFTFEDVMRDPQIVVRAVREALRARGAAGVRRRTRRPR